MKTEKIPYIFKYKRKKRNCCFPYKSKKNKLIEQGRYTDAVDDVLCKVLSTKKRNLKIK